MSNNNGIAHALIPLDRRRVVLGALFVTAAGLMFALAAASIKMASTSLSSASIVFWRNVISLIILTPWAVWYGAKLLQTENLNLILLRSVAVLASLYCYYFAIAAIPIVDAVLLNFSSPIFVPILGFLLYRFPLDKAVLLAAAVGFIGVALVLKPGTGVFDSAALARMLHQDPEFWVRAGRFNLDDRPQSIAQLWFAEERSRWTCRTSQKPDSALGYISLLATIRLTRCNTSPKVNFGAPWCNMRAS